MTDSLPLLVFSGHSYLKTLNIEDSPADLLPSWNNLGLINNPRDLGDTLSYLFPPTTFL